MDPVDNPNYYKYGVFYFNKEDSRTVVPKKNRSLGWTLNFAAWKSYLFLGMIAASIILSFVIH